MIAIIDYDTGNLRSVCNALDRIGAEYCLTDDPAVIAKADRVLLPGVGEASSAMQKLQERGLCEVIRSLKVPVLGICIGMQLMCRHSEEGNVDCLGIFDADVQKFEANPSEGIKVPHMGWNTISDLRTDLFKGLGNLADMESGPSVLLSQPACSGVESGSMSHGSDCSMLQSTCSEVESGSTSLGSDRGMSQPSDVFVYFVHSFAASVCDDTIAVSENGRKFSAAMHKDNFYGAQFHPEKSGDVGEMILKNFMNL